MHDANVERAVAAATAKKLAKDDIRLIDLNIEAIGHKVPVRRDQKEMERRLADFQTRSVTQKRKFEKVVAEMFRKFIN